MINNKVFFRFIFLSILLFNSCSSSKKEKIGVYNTDHLQVVHQVKKTLPVGRDRDSTIILSFYEILNKDTLRIKPISFNNIYDFRSRIKFSAFAWRANVSGNVVIEFEIDSSGRGNNVRVLSEIGGVGQSLAEAIYQFKFDYIQNIYTNGYPLLLIAYINLWTSMQTTPTQRIQN